MTRHSPPEFTGAIGHPISQPKKSFRFCETLDRLAEVP